MSVGKNQACHSLWLSDIPWCSVPSSLMWITLVSVSDSDTDPLGPETSVFPPFSEESGGARVAKAVGLKNTDGDLLLHLKSRWMDIVSVPSSGGRSVRSPVAESDFCAVHLLSALPGCSLRKSSFPLILLS